MGFAIVRKLKRGRGKPPAWAVVYGGKTLAIYEDNGKLGYGSANEQAMKEARRLNARPKPRP